MVNPTFGYKLSANADNRYKLIRKIKVSTASEHDTLHLDEVLDTLLTPVGTFMETKAMWQKLALHWARSRHTTTEL